MVRRLPPKLHPHKTDWDFDWRNPDMKVLRRPFYQTPVGLVQREEIVSSEESSKIANESFEDSASPDFSTDPSYQWGKKHRLAVKRRKKEHKAALDVAKRGIADGTD